MGAYRGYGQAESNYVREVLVDRLARRLGQDPADFRRRHLLRPDELPFKNVSGATYDSGDYARALELALSRVGYETFRTRQKAWRRAGAPRRRRHVVLRGVHRLSVLRVSRPHGRALRRLRERDRAHGPGRARRHLHRRVDVRAGHGDDLRPAGRLAARARSRRRRDSPRRLAGHAVQRGRLREPHDDRRRRRHREGGRPDPRQDAAHRGPHPRRRCRGARGDRRRDPPPRRSRPCRSRSSACPRRPSWAIRCRRARIPAWRRRRTSIRRRRRSGTARWSRRSEVERAQRRVRAAALHPRPRLRHPGQPDDRRGPGAGRGGPGHRRRAVRGARLRPRRPGSS